MAQLSNYNGWQVPFIVVVILHNRKLAICFARNIADTRTACVRSSGWNKIGPIACDYKTNKVPGVYDNPVTFSV